MWLAVGGFLVLVAGSAYLAAHLRPVSWGEGLPVVVVVPVLVFLLLSPGLLAVLLSVAYMLLSVDAARNLRAIRKNLGNRAS
jgi:hypothetical protein